MHPKVLKTVCQLHLELQRHDLTTQAWPPTVTDQWIDTFRTEYTAWQQTSSPLTLDATARMLQVPVPAAASDDQWIPARDFFDRKLKRLFKWSAVNEEKDEEDPGVQGFSLTDEFPENVKQVMNTVMDQIGGNLMDQVQSSEQPEQVVMKAIKNVEEVFRTKMANNEITEDDVKQTAGALQKQLQKLKTKLPGELAQLLDLLEQAINQYLNQDKTSKHATESNPLDMKDMAGLLSDFMDFSKDVQSGQIRGGQHPFVKKMMAKLMRMLHMKTKGARLSAKERLQLLLEKRKDKSK